MAALDKVADHSVGRFH